MRCSAASPRSRCDSIEICCDIDKHVFNAEHTDEKVADALRESHWYDLREWTATGPGSAASSPGFLDRQDLLERPRVDDVGGRRPAPPGRPEREHDVAEPARRVGVRGDDDRDARLDRLTDVLVLQVEPVGEAVRLECGAGLERDLEGGVEVERVRRAPVDQPSGRDG